MNLELKSQPKLNTHNHECLVKFSDQKTQPIGQSKTQTESEENLFFENRCPSFYSLYLPFCDLFIDVPP